MSRENNSAIGRKKECPKIEKLNFNGFLEIVSAAVFQSVINPKAAIVRWAAIRKAFHNFEARRVAGMGETEIGELLQKKEIIRNRKKIVATIENAKAIIEIETEYGTLEAYLGSFDHDGLIDDLSCRIKYIGKPSIRWVLNCFKIEKRIV
jgi:3-methyladenine DNA glycosylase Tag